MRTFIQTFIVIIFVLGIPISLFAQGSTSSSDVFPSSKITRNQKKHTISIKRFFANAEEERLLKIAESIYPPETEIIENCNAATGSDDWINPTGLRWWCGSFDGVFMPHAVTKGAVEYYLTVTDEFRQNNFSRTHKLRMEHTDFSYSAEVNHRSKIVILDKYFIDVYEIGMSLSWSQYCGNLCAMSTSAKRTIVLDKKGTILLLSGDGEMRGMIS